MIASRIRATSVIAIVAALTALGGCGKPTPAPPVAQNPGVKLPSYWVATDIADNWPGKHWSKIDLFSYVKNKPAGLDSGTHYVVFFGRTCEHCEAMFHEDLAPNPALSAQVTAIEVPVEADRLRGDDPWPLPETNCTFGQLRLGPNWIMTTPVTVRLQDGIVQCAQEGGHKECMGLD